MTIENRRNEIRAHNNIWDQRRIEVKNKEYLITPHDYKTFVPKQRQINLEQIEEVAVELNAQTNPPQNASPAKNKSVSPKQKKNKHVSVEREEISVAKDGVVVRGYDHLSNFTIDKPKIDFFLKAKEITTRLDKSERFRDKLIKKKVKEVSCNIVQHQEKAKQNQKLLKMDVKDRIEAIEVKGAQKIEAVVAVKEAWKKDVDTYKEMRLLKKQDQ